MIFSLIFLKLLSSLSIFLLVWIIGAVVLLHRTLPQESTSINYAESFANGVFLGTVLFHLIPDAAAALQQLGTKSNYPIIYLLTAVSFILLFALERHAEPLKRFSAVNSAQLFILYLLITLFSLHSISAGIALGFSPSLSNAGILWIAILAHKGCEAYAIAVNIAGHIKTRSHQFGLLTIFASMTPLGIALAMITRFHLSNDHALLAEAYFNAIAAGTFLYIATLHSTVGQWRQGLRAIPLLPLLIGMGDHGCRRSLDLEFI